MRTPAPRRKKSESGRATLSSRNTVRHGATQARAQAGGGSLSPQFDQQTFSVFAAFALGYAAALLIHRRSQ
jgi:hypothetical protein